MVMSRRLRGGGHFLAECDPLVDKQLSVLLFRRLDPLENLRQPLVSHLRNHWRRSGVFLTNSFDHVMDLPPTLTREFDPR